MIHKLYLDDAQAQQVELEVVSTGLRVYLCRLIDQGLTEGDGERSLGLMNFVVNMSRSISELPIYVLEADDMGMYQAPDYHWNRGDFLLAFRRPSTVQLVELVCSLIQKGVLDLGKVNEAFRRENLSIQITQSNNSVKVVVADLDVLSEDEDKKSHPNVRLLISRMKDALNRSDFTGVLHASASVFETVAKDIVEIDSVQDKTLGGFFDKYKKESGLPNEIADKILQVYKLRNTEPLAGHGSTAEPSFNEEEAITLSELTVAFVRIEYRMRAASIARH